MSNLDTVQNAFDSPDFGNYPDANYHSNMTDGASNYFKNFTDSVISYGYVIDIDGN